MVQTQCYRIQVSRLRIHRTTDRQRARLTDYHNLWRHRLIIAINTNTKEITNVFTKT